MKLQVVLDEADIKTMVANSYNVDESKVHCDYHQEYEGHGTMEACITKFEVTVDLPANETR